MRLGEHRGLLKRRWKTVLPTNSAEDPNIPTYAAVRYKDVYPGIDQVYYGNQGQVEYDFVVAPGADPDVIRIRFDGSAPFPDHNHHTR